MAEQIFDSKVSSASVGAAGGSSLGGALAILIAGFLKRVYGQPLEATEAIALATVMTSFCAFSGALITGYMRRQKILPAHNEGFTLIELLVVIGILGILVSIAVPQFQTYRKRAFDAAVRSDLRNAAIAEEAYVGSSGEYTTSIDALKEHGGLNLSPDVELKIETANGQLTITARSIKCAPETGQWTFSNVTGQFLGRNCE
jgi:prepilin-type N-terminal cleavage/methylation domain-containing protein